jgi:hypothetical protein
MHHQGGRAASRWQVTKHARVVRGGHHRGWRPPRRAAFRGLAIGEPRMERGEEEEAFRMAITHSAWRRADTFPPSARRGSPTTVSARNSEEPHSRQTSTRDVHAGGGAQRCSASSMKGPEEDPGPEATSGREDDARPGAWVRLEVSGSCSRSTNSGWDVGGTWSWDPPWDRGPPGSVSARTVRTKQQAGPRSGAPVVAWCGQKGKLRILAADLLAWRTRAR